MAKLLKASLLIIILAVTTLVFHDNLFQFAPTRLFNSFQKDSESLVVGKLAADRLDIETTTWLGKLEGYDTGGTPVDPESEALLSLTPSTGLTFKPYLSQYGLQGRVFSTLYQKLPIQGLSIFHVTNSLLLVITITALAICYASAYNKRYAVFFWLTLITSPWIILFAKNLYWVPFTWFLPALFAALAYLRRRWFYYVGVFIAVFIKSLSGYEYLSTITLFAGSIFIAAPLFSSRPVFAFKNVLKFLLVCTLCTSAFACALMLHAQIRGPSLLDGLHDIYENDVKRRTYGNAADFDDAYARSLRASPAEVVTNYVLYWATPVFLKIPGSFFKFLLGLALILSLAKGIRSGFNPQKWTDFFFFLLMLLPPLSWLILAKSHSHVHTNMNYVVWYFGLVPASTYIIFESARPIAKSLNRKIRDAKTDCL